MNDIITVQTFKHSERSFCAGLDELGISYHINHPQPGRIMACGITINIILGSAGVAALAKMAIAWIKARESRQINITTKNGDIVDIKGNYTANEVKKLLTEARQTMIIDTKPEE